MVVRAGGCVMRGRRRRAVVVVSGVRPWRGVEVTVLSAFRGARWPDVCGDEASRCLGVPVEVSGSLGLWVSGNLRPWVSGSRGI